MRTRSKIKKIYLVFVLLFCFNIQQDIRAQVNLVPKPQQIDLGDKTIDFRSITIDASNDFKNEVEFLKQFEINSQDILEEDLFPSKMESGKLPEDRITNIKDLIDEFMSKRE